MKNLAVCIRWFLALVLGTAAGLKIGAHGSAETLFGSLPLTLQWGVIGAELLLAAALVSGWPSRPVALAAITLFSVFLAAILIDMGQAAPRSCGCLGGLPQMDLRAGLRMSLGVDVVLLALSLALYFIRPSRRGGA